MSAPSFSSFPPSFSSFPDLDSATSSPQKESSQKARRNQREDREPKDKHRKRRKRDHGSSKQRPEDYTRSKDEQDHQRFTAASSSDVPLFYSDRKGDPLNVTYGGIHAGDVPKYNLVSRGKKILGLPTSLSVNHRSGKGVEIGPGGSRKVLSLTDPKAKALLAAPPKRRITQAGDHYRYKEIDGYLPLPARSRRKDKKADRSIALADDHTDAESSSSEEDEDTDSSASNERSATTLTALQETLQNLERALSSDPSSVSIWLSLLSHSLSSIPPNSKNATKARSEITLSILARALHAHESNKHSALLRVKYLRAGQEIWSDKMLQAEWEETLREAGPGLWMEWLEWRIARGSKGVTGIVEDARRVLQVLHADEEAEIAKVRVFWRVAVALRDAGFSERAMAMFQAQCELTFKLPQDVSGLPWPHLLDALEQFWESEVPRIGEMGAKGWSSWLATKQTDPPGRPSSSLALQQVEPIADPYSAWYARECLLDSSSILPTRSSDESADADPYAAIFFSDIRDTLIDLKFSRSKNVLRLAWLAFLGLHLPGLSASLSSSDLESWDDRWSCTYFRSPSFLQSIYPQSVSRITAESVAGTVIGHEKEYPSVFGPVRSWGYDIVHPLEFFDSSTFGSLWNQQDFGEIDTSLVQRIFEHLRLSSTDDCAWDALALAFEAVASMKRALKQARSFLSVARDSLPHWAAHAKLERRRGRLDDARKVYHTVLIASPPSRLSDHDSIQLWWDWAEMEWLAGRNLEAMQVMLKAAGVEGNSGMSVLRAKRALEGDLNALGCRDRWKSVYAKIQLRALLELLTTSIDAALDIYDGYLQDSDVALQGVIHEALTVASLMMLYRYSTVLKNATPPALLRDRASKALQIYPSNSIFFGLFLEGEKGQGVWGRVRAVLGDNVVRTTEKDVARRVEEVWVAGWDKTRWESEIERTRAGLDGAVSNERTKGSAIIWSIYIAFEIRAGQLKRAKNLLFRAIRECPLVKDLYLIAYGPLRSVFTAVELKTLADTMAERQIRMRVDLYEVLEGLEGDEVRSGSPSSGTDSEDEIEQRAREYRRLRPY